MEKYATSLGIVKNTKNFLDLRYYSFKERLLRKKGVFYGWGRKRSGLEAVKLAKKYNTSYVLLEDGFIRSLGLGVNGSPSFSLVEDDIGIYYDATKPSRLENILNSYDFSSVSQLMQNAKEAIDLILDFNISKYNYALDVPDSYFKDGAKKRVLIVAQTAKDASIKYGMLESYTTKDIIDAAISENPDATIYLKVHPDVLSGKKRSDIDINTLPKKCNIITQDFNPISLLRYFDTVYTKTSQMGFEALLVGCKTVCFGMPFYAGWGITDDRVGCSRRERKLTVNEIFAGAYLLYTRYFNSYTKKESNILDVIKTIVDLKNAI